VVANASTTIISGPRELSVAELDLVAGGIDWGSVFRTAVQGIYAVAGAFVAGPGGALAGAVIGNVAGQASVEGTAYGDAHPAMMM
jgi:hypothetical protein